MWQDKSTIDKEPKKEYHKEESHMRVSELKFLLKKNGCYKISEGARHEHWYSPITNKIFQVSRHNTEDVKKGTLHRILTDAGLK